jgi:hypothetical protein
MGKYSHIIKSLPILPPEDIAFQEKVQLVKETLLKTHHTPQEIVEGYEVTRFGEVPLEMLSDDFKENMIKTLGKEGLKGLLAEVNKTMAAYEQLMTESQDRGDEGWGLYGATDTMLKLPDGGSVNIQHEPVGKVEDTEAFNKWVHDNDLDDQKTLPWQRREEIIKTRALNGEPAPDGVKVYARPKVVFKRA